MRLVSLGVWVSGGLSCTVTGYMQSRSCIHSQMSGRVRARPCPPPRGEEEAGRIPLREIVKAKNVEKQEGEVAWYKRAAVIQRTCYRDGNQKGLDAFWRTLCGSCAGVVATVGAEIITVEAKDRAYPTTTTTTS
ncbi:hypothetical protein E2C01_030953 [Portunus trituberculatus]|uniref:Uncharacterized protein n=1 Tax=Portunus trituberculatus TaxID=210409 RepID=A0A5B7ET81_PORTR|nr:hypothetical protein [Portunus trituberculatus]